MTIHCYLFQHYVKMSSCGESSESQSESEMSDNELQYEQASSPGPQINWGEPLHQQPENDSNDDAMTVCFSEDTSTTSWTDTLISMKKQSTLAHPIPLIQLLVL